MPGGADHRSVWIGARGRRGGSRELMDGEMNLIEMELREILMKEDVMGSR